MSRMSLLCALVLGACGHAPKAMCPAGAATATPSEDASPPEPRVELVPANFTDLPGWKDDTVSQAVPVFVRSCAIWSRKKDSTLVGPDGIAGTVLDWREVCRAAKAHRDGDAHAFFERWFAPYRVSNRGDPEGSFTGYYEATIRASRTKRGSYKWPVVGRPDDLVMVYLKDFRDDPDPRRVAGRVEHGRLRPYETREQITNGSLGKRHVLFWADDPIDVFFAQIQGSARVVLPGGGEVRIGYAGWNGHPYTAIGRVLVAQQEIQPDDLSMQSIRAWLLAHPERAHEIMNTNVAFSFFRVVKQKGALGASRVVLTPERSMAVDPVYVPLGAPLFVDTEVPVPHQPTTEPWQKLVIAQDTGGAIRRPVRGDIFWGYGERAFEIAGRLRSKGRYYLLLPRNIVVPGPLSASPKRTTHRAAVTSASARSPSGTVPTHGCR